MGKLSSSSMNLVQEGSEEGFSSKTHVNDIKERERKGREKQGIGGAGVKILLEGRELDERRPGPEFGTCWGREEEGRWQDGRTCAIDLKTDMRR